MQNERKSRAGLFIDAANLFFTQRFLGWQIDFSRLIAYFMQRFDSVEARYYVPEGEEIAPDQVSFYRMLQASGYSITAKPVKKILDRQTGELVVKGNLDVELAVDALMMADSFDSFILLSGDGDFLPLLKALRSMNKEVEVYSTRGLSARELVQEPGVTCHDISLLRSRIEHLPASSQGDKQQDADEVSDHAECDLPVKGTMFTGSVLSVKPYGIFLSNPFRVKCLLPLSFLGVETRITSLPSLVRQTDLFRVAVFDTDCSEREPKMTVKLVDRQMSAELDRRARRFSASASGA
ncbi:NYN domain-containing protein [Prosthecochloris sp. HL-130-GSB]|jgi:uncharacterized LabA/DUF88 family protein|uniref:LabA-like NYN domain-containing protein n=1 Tax=Prosthecochloris sp. HL-130-GSB TaxID=1974213 RepID=UPI000A1C0B67|nr:NYN domain-containing protein [Prosthecochloris sp. HL-130-GSB]ARM30331.1 NYN domain-containing protein [Prosthecochloris sp. HL-130-GSB]MBO8091957.1 NYN domain-containing protein [Prosthecochloris sp.]